MAKINLGIVLGHMCASGLPDRVFIDDCGLIMDELIVNQRLPKHIATKIATRMGIDPSVLKEKSQNRKDSFVHKIDPVILKNRIKELGWTNSCLNQVCCDTENVIRCITYGNIDRIYGSELVNICYFLECDLLYLQGKRKEPTVTQNYHVSYDRFRKFDSSSLIDHFKNCGIDDMQDMVDAVSKKLKCSNKYASMLLFNNIEVSKQMLTRINSIIIKTPLKNDLVLREEPVDKYDSVEVSDIENNTKSSGGTRSELSESDMHYELSEDKEIKDYCEVKTEHEKKQDVTLEILKMVVKCPSTIEILKMISDVPEEKRQKVLDFIKYGIELIKE